MAPRYKNNQTPIPSIFHPKAYSSLMTLLNKIQSVEDMQFEPAVSSLAKALHFKYASDFYKEHGVADVTAFIASGIGFTHYHHPRRGKVVTAIYGAGEIAFNPDSFFNGKPADSSLSFIAGTNILYLTIQDIELLCDRFEQAKSLTTKILASMSGQPRMRDELLRLPGKNRIIRFFEIYPALLRPARQAPMQYKDIASYLNIDQFHFSALMKDVLA